MRARWTPQSLLWFEKAAAHSNYHQKFAEHIIASLPNTKRVCDLGAGAGELCFALARRGIAVDAVEEDALAADYIRRKSQEYGVSSLIHVVHDDWTKSQNIRPCDVAVLSYCSGVCTEFARLNELAQKNIVVLTGGKEAPTPFGLKNMAVHKRKRRETGDMVREFLTENGARFAEEEFCGELGQVLDNDEELQAFLAHYFPEEVAKTALEPARAALQTLDDGRLFLPRFRQSALFFIETAQR